MIWTAHTVAKHKTGNLPGDDICIVIPGICAAVFDGATRSETSPVTGISAGRAAAIAGAQSLARMAAGDLSAHSADAIFHAIDRDIGTKAKELHFSAPIQTTAAITLESDDSFRILVLGDSGVRVNQTDVITQNLKVDRLSIAARVAIWRHIRPSQETDFRTEAVTRKIIVNGLPWAERQGLVTSDDIQTLTGRIKAQLEQEFHPYVDVFLMQGIDAQHGLMNNPDHPLWYPILDGSSFSGGAVEEVLPKQSVNCIEIFSDGYSNLPNVASIDAWEAAYHVEERRDPNRLTDFPAIKGSTETEWSDDRSVIIGTAK